MTLDICTEHKEGEYRSIEININNTTVTDDVLREVEDAIGDIISRHLDYDQYVFSVF